MILWFVWALLVSHGSFKQLHSVSIQAGLEDPRKPFSCFWILSWFFSMWSLGIWCLIIQALCTWYLSLRHEDWLSIMTSKRVKAEAARFKVWIWNWQSITLVIFCVQKQDTRLAQREENLSLPPHGKNGMCVQGVTGQVAATVGDYIAQIALWLYSIPSFLEIC